ncbi:MAG: leucyl aminopeptidase [Saprospiraceae bacterium]|nr:leucyl aminopeptidase [Saprospiraceae bacterium]
MKVLISTTFSTQTCGTVIIPILKAESLGATLESIGQTFNVSIDRLKTDIKGDFKEINHFYNGETRIYLLGLGEKTNSNDIIAAARNLSFTQKSKFNGGRIAIDLIHSNLTESHAVQSMVNGILLGAYRIGLYKSDSNGIHPLCQSEAELVVFVDGDAERSEKEAQKALLTAQTQIQIMDLVNAAPNIKTPQYLANWAIQSGEKNGFSVQAFDKKQCIELGFKALLSVNAGSQEEPRFIVMEYKHEKAQKTVGLVGKGVTFDTGGISIKPSNNMHLMKSDMGGAAAVLGTMELVAKLQLPINLIGIVPATENMVDGAGTRPGDVIDSYAGKTIEVIDTDAEGRLVLADGLAYMKKQYNPDVMIDLATLTGNVIAALGYNAAGLFCNNDTLSNALLKAGEASGERVWRMPMWEAYFEDMKSDVADIANLSSKPVAGSITAAKFLEFFIDNHTGWAHIDIAGMALATTELGNHRTATAYGIRLLTDFLESWV